MKEISQDFSQGIILYIEKWHKEKIILIQLIAQWNELKDCCLLVNLVIGN